MKVTTLNYVEDIQALAPLFYDESEFKTYIREYAKNFGLYSIALLNNDSNNSVFFSTTFSVYNHESELKAINSARRNKNTVVKTITDSDLLFTASGTVELFEEKFILIIQKRMSDNEYISKIAEETDTGITLYIDDIIVATSHKDANGKYLSGKFENQEILSIVFAFSNILLLILYIKIKQKKVKTGKNFLQENILYLFSCNSFLVRIGH